MQQELGEDISAQAMLAYFEPLQAWLEEQNAGREHALPETPNL
jgi:peptidyl-dipeptidase A